MHLAKNSSVISHQIVHLPVQFAYGAIHTVEFWVLPSLNNAIILGIPFLHTLNPSIYKKTPTFVW